MSCKNTLKMCDVTYVLLNYYNAAKMLQFPISLDVIAPSEIAVVEWSLGAQKSINIRLPGVVPTRGYNDPTWLSPKPLPSDFSQPSGGLKSQWKAESQGFFSAFLAIKWMPLELHEIHLSRKSGPKILLKHLEAASCCILQELLYSGRVFVTIKLERHSSWPLGEGIGKEMVTQLMRSQLVKLQCQLRVLLVLDESKDCT